MELELRRYWAYVALRASTTPPLGLGQFVAGSIEHSALPYALPAPSLPARPHFNPRAATIRNAAHAAMLRFNPVHGPGLVMGTYRAAPDF